jgi:flagellar motor switch protein FliN/FliY
MTDTFPPDGPGEAGAELDVAPPTAAFRAEPRAAARTDGPMQRLGMISSIETEVSVVLGRARLPIRELLALGPGAILELDRKPNEPVDILVNGTLIARGEVVVVDEDFGVRISEIVVQRED